MKSGYILLLFYTDSLKRYLINKVYTKIEFKGWNNNGIPTKETLQELDLDYIYEDFKQRGIYDDVEK